MRHSNLKFFALLISLLLPVVSNAEIKNDIEYAKPDGVSQTLDVSMPDGNGPFPIAILIHGGGWSTGDKAKDFAWLKQPLTDAKFTWFAINYRLAPKYRWPACIDDVQAALTWVRAHAGEYKGDPKRIALIGYSAGAHLVCYCVTHLSSADQIQGVAVYAPPTDLELDLPERGGLSQSLQNLLGQPHELTDQSRQMLHDISPIHFIKPGLPPFLIVHGDADKSVPYPGTLNFQAKLQEAGVPCELVTMKGALHNSAKWDNFDKTYTAKTIDWLVRTVADPTPTTQPVPTEITVAADGSEKYKTVQDAINAVPQFNPPRDFVIHMKPGKYRELLYIQHEKLFVHLVGEDPEKTIITYDLFAKMPGPDGQPISTFRTPTFTIDADHFTAENLTFENSAGPKGQALAVRIDGDAVAFRNCRFLGYQDTIFVNRGRHYFQDCYITGAVDFIFGAATDYFEHCHIHCLANGYITAASTPQNQKFGFVFNHCTVTSEPGVKTYLGRPWRPFAATTYLNTEMSDAVRPLGWNDWGHADRQPTSRYSEFNSTGPGASPNQRANWTHALTADQAAELTPDRVLGRSDHWQPAKF